MKQLFHAVLYDQAIYETSSSVTKLLKSSKTVSQSFNGLFTLNLAAHWYPISFNSMIMTMPTLVTTLAPQ